MCCCDSQSQQSSEVHEDCAHGIDVLVQDRMSKLDVVVHRSLYKVGVLLPPRLGDDMSHELLDSGVDVFLARARHGRILALLPRQVLGQVYTAVQIQDNSRRTGQARVVSIVAAV